MFPPHIFGNCEDINELTRAYVDILSNKKVNKNFKAILLDCCWSELNLYKRL
jgi:hypothetical protein